MVERFFGKNLLALLAGVVALPPVLKKEGEELKKAMEEVTREGGKSEIIVEGVTYVVTDPGKTGREIKSP